MTENPTDQMREEKRGPFYYARALAHRLSLSLKALAKGNPRLSLLLLRKKGWLWLAMRQMEEFALDFHIIDHCNLGCSHCMHYSPLAEGGELSPDEVESQLRSVSGLVDIIHLLGGEPLLHPDIVACLGAARRACPDARLVIITNGILLEGMPELFWEACRDNKVAIQMSHYPLGLDYGALEEMIRAHGVHVQKYVFNDKANFWRAPIDENGRGDAAKAFGQCWHNTQLYRGRFYRCSNCAFIPVLNETFGRSIPVADDDWLDISQVRRKSDLIEFTSRPSSFCRYCGFDRMELCAWSLSKHAPEEWISVEEEA